MLALLLVAATINVAATTTDLRELVAAVGGDRVRVESLTDSRQGHHPRELLPRQLTVLAKTDLLVRVGLDNEPWLPQAVRSVKPRARDLDLSKVITPITTETARLRADSRPHIHAFGSPNYWLDPENAHALTGAILEALGAMAPADRPVFERNRSQFLAQVDAGMARWLEQLRPYRGTRVVVGHDAWPYFARRFGLTITATVEEKPGVPPSPKYLGTLIDRMRQAGVRVIIADPESPMALLQRISEATGARITLLVPSVGADPAATDYLTLFEVNVARLLKALAL
jgi:ABC-type Zn uptake system ZnuABC Zn-binding protein ZnuA